MRAAIAGSSIIVTGFGSQHFAGAQRIDDVLGDRTAENPLTQRGDDDAALDHRFDGDAVGGAAILLEDDAVLGHVDQTPGQVARVRRLQRRVGQALAGTVGRVEVLEHGQAFLEVRDDRRLDDFARRLGHQAAHAGQLLHLRRRTTRAGVGHHVDRVDLLARLGGRDFLHHLVGHRIGAVRPGVDHLVVLLALGDLAVLVLLFVFLDQRLGLADEFDLRRRNDQVVLAERHARLARIGVAERHHPVGEDDRLLLTAIAVDDVDRGSEISRLVSKRLIRSNEIAGWRGRISEISIRPGVVSTR